MKYILKNISKYDVNLGDLRYTIPAQQSRDLLGKNARLNFDDIKKSRENGSISRKLGISLVEIENIVLPRRPVKKQATLETIAFPKNTKTSIIINVAEIEDNISILNEEDELLKELEQSYESDSSPLLVNEKKT